MSGKDAIASTVIDESIQLAPLNSKALEDGLQGGIVVSGSHE